MQRVKYRIGHFLVVLSALMLIGLAGAEEIQGVPVEDHTLVNGMPLVLNGSGVRTKLFFKVYVAALYVTGKSSDPQVLMGSRGAWRMRLQLLRDLDAETLLGALRDGLEANLTPAEKIAQAGSIDQLSLIMRRVGSLRKGDGVILDYANDKVTVSTGGESRGVVDGAGFGRALLAVWLGEHPVDAALKKALLGG